MNLPELLKLMIQKGISDIHFKANAAPLIRVHGNLIGSGGKVFDAREISDIAQGFMDKDQRARFESERELDMSYSVEGVSRFRVNVYRQRGTVALTLRVVPLTLKGFGDLNLPAQVLKKLCSESRGLILISGITGSGKTTTLNAMLDHINKNISCNIVTVEDPIEFYHKDEKSSISQREVGQDTLSFKSALKYVLRQDPDVVSIGEMRDFEAIQAAITAAETGHLVLSTIHTMDAVQTIDRIVDSYPPHLQHQVRNQLSNVLKGVVAQRLVSHAENGERLPATEILVVTSLVRKLIADGKSAEIYKAMEQGEYYGMHTFDQDLLRLHRDKKISMEDAMEDATNPDDLMLKVRGIAGVQSA